MPHPIMPATVTIARAVRHSGLSRASLYRLAGDGRLTFLKAGRSTLVDFASLTAHLASLPRATIRAAA